MNKPSQPKFDGVRALVDMFSEMDADRREKLLEKVKERDPELFGKIDAELVTFDKILGQELNVLSIIAQEIPTEVWALALRGLAEPETEKLFGAMATRRATEIRDEIDALGAQPKRKVLEARKQIVQVVRELSRLKKFDLIG